MILCSDSGGERKIHIIILKHLLTDHEFRDFVNEIGFELDMLEGKTNILPINNFLNKILSI